MKQVGEDRDSTFVEDHDGHDDHDDRDYHDDHDNHDLHCDHDILVDYDNHDNHNDHLYLLYHDILMTLVTMMATRYRAARAAKMNRGVKKKLTEEEREW